jgi:hypothetical protein
MVPRLRLFAGASGEQCQRQGIYTVNNTGYSRVSAGSSVTHSLTIRTSKT